MDSILLGPLGLPLVAVTRARQLSYSSPIYRAMRSCCWRIADSRVLHQVLMRSVQVRALGIDRSVVIDACRGLLYMPKRLFWITFSLMIKISQAKKFHP
jgi:hypothetical protein